MNRSSIILTAGVLVAASAALAQQRPVVHFTASDDRAFASARITVDGSAQESSTVSVTLTSPSGSAETLEMERDGARHTWVGQLPEAGTWRVEAVLEGRDGRQTNDASLTLSAGEPTCSVSLSGPEEATSYLESLITVNVCASEAVSGDLARYVRVMQDGVQVAALNATEQCERSFTLPGSGAFEAIAEITDDRGTTATCSSNDVDIEAIHAGYWLLGDVVTGLYRTTQSTIVPDDAAAPFGGAAVGVTISHNAAAEDYTAFTARAAAAVGLNEWFGTTFDAIVTRHNDVGFFGAGVGLWGLGNSTLLDAAVIATGGLHVNNYYYQAGQTQVFGELRLFARHATDWSNHYAALVGIRTNFRPLHKLQVRPSN